jgi:hypothetical protein
LIIGRPFGLQLYKIVAQQQVILALKKIPKRATIISEDNPRGWVWGWPYFGYILETTNSGHFGPSANTEFYLYTTKNFYNTITTHKPINLSDKPQTISMWTRTGNYFGLHYSKRDLDVTKCEPRKNQEEPLETIIKHFSAKNHTVVYLHGDPGTGKSMIPLLLAKKMNGSYCIAHNPTNPGDSIDLLYNAVCPTTDNPLVIVFEEIDIMVDKIHTGRINMHKNIPTQIMDKIGFNTYLDLIDRGLYPSLILIMTSNKSPEYIDSLDGSYIREGRVDLRIKINVFDKSVDSLDDQCITDTTINEGNKKLD